MRRYLFCTEGRSAADIASIVRKRTLTATTSTSLSSRRCCGQRLGLRTASTGVVTRQRGRSSYQPPKYHIDNPAPVPEHGRRQLENRQLNRKTRLGRFFNDKFANGKRGVLAAARNRHDLDRGIQVRITHRPHPHATPPLHLLATPQYHTDVVSTTHGMTTAHHAGTHTY